MIQLYIHTHLFFFFFRPFPHIGYHRVLGRVRYALQQVPIGHPGSSRDSPSLQNPSQKTLEADLGDIVGSVPDPCNKVDIAIKPVTQPFGFPMHRGVTFIP